jgi:hypothetical protein
MPSGGDLGDESLVVDVGGGVEAEALGETAIAPLSSALTRASASESKAGAKK